MPNWSPQSLEYPGFTGMSDFFPGGRAFVPRRDTPESPYWLASPARPATNELGRTPPAPLQPAFAEMPWIDVLRMAVQNIPSSAEGVLRNYITPFIHPIDWSTDMIKTLVGTAQKAIPGRQSLESYPEMIWENMKQRYGGEGQIKETFASDPVGLITDALSLAGPGLSALPGRIAGKAAAAVNAADPTQLLQRGVTGGVSALENLKNRVDPQAQKLMNEGITPTLGQSLGGTAARWEEQASSMPVVGDLIKRARSQAGVSFNKATYQRVLDPIGESAEEIPTGAAGVRELGNRLSKKYDELLPTLKIKANDDLFSEINKVLEGYAEVLPENKKKQLDGLVDRNVVKPFIKDGEYRELKGDRLKNMQTELRVLKRKFQGKSGSDSLMADALDDFDKIIHEGLKKENPAKAKELSDLDAGWARFKIVQKAAASAGASTERGFSPAQLESAARNLDTSIGKGQTATGQGLFSDFAQTARDVLGPNEPDSGTAGRGLAAGAVLGSTAMFNPTAAMGMLGASLPYTSVGQKALSKLTKGKTPSLTKLNQMLKAAPNVGGAAYWGGRASGDWLSPEEYTEHMREPRENLQQSVLDYLMQGGR